MRYEIVPNKRGYIQKKDRSHGNMKAMNENFEGTLDFETSDSILHVFDLVFPFKVISIGLKYTLDSPTFCLNIFETILNLYIKYFL